MFQLKMWLNWSNTLMSFLPLLTQQASHHTFINITTYKENWSIVLLMGSNLTWNLLLLTEVFVILKYCAVSLPSWTAPHPHMPHQPCLLKDRHYHSLKSFHQYLLTPHCFRVLLHRGPSRGMKLSSVTGYTLPPLTSHALPGMFQFCLANTVWFNAWGNWHHHVYHWLPIISRNPSHTLPGMTMTLLMKWHASKLDKYFMCYLIQKMIVFCRHTHTLPHEGNQVVMYPSLSSAATPSWLGRALCSDLMPIDSRPVTKVICLRSPWRTMEARCSVTKKR